MLNEDPRSHCEETSSTGRGQTNGNQDSQEFTKFYSRQPSSCRNQEWRRVVPDSHPENFGLYNIL